MLVLHTQMPIWSYLELSGTIWSYLELSGAICIYLELSGVIWSYLKLSGAIWAKFLFYGIMLHTIPYYTHIWDYAYQPAYPAWPA